jgi:hypothetical protein
LSRNQISKWVDFKTTHQLDGCTQNTHAHPLGWGNNKIEIEINTDELLVTIWEHMREIKRGEDEGILLN